ncbi:MAG: hypothetical protein JW741_08455 [Sedimentisphaerales bacterium]|nr:hypothetical protein [Sedimentisphaerales bacterium]
MRKRDSLILFASLLIAVALLIGAGLQLDYVNKQREAMNITINAPLENAPPSLAFATVAMGAFRGLVVDILWMRADKLKDEGQFFDARQLAEWITTLQPRFGAVWEFHAWNMAYNISVAIPASQPEERFRWVRNGYELLRDKGIPLNPKSIQLYRELGRIFQHKMGGVSDEAHKYYKLRLAEMLGPLLRSEDNGLEREDNAYFEALIAAPRTWAQVAGDPNVQPFIEALQAADGTFRDEEQFVANYLTLRQNPGRFGPATFAVVDQFRGTKALKEFDLFAKAYQLRNEWKLEPVLMHEINQTHGPIDLNDPNTHYPMDWRHPDSHAIYWAVKALKLAAEEEDREVTTDETNTDRIVAHSHQNLFRYGKMMILEGPAGPAVQEDPNATTQSRLVRKDIFLGPDYRMFDSYNKATLAILEKHKDDKGRYESLRNGYRNMLKNAVLTFYQSGIRGYALRIYNQLRQMYPEMGDFKVSLDQYAKNRLAEELESIDILNARELIVATLAEAYYHYALRSDDLAAAREQIAQKIYDYYMAKFRPENRIDLPDMRELRYFALGLFLNNEAYPPYVRQGLLARIRIERPELYKQLEQIGEKLRQQMEASQGTP